MFWPRAMAHGLQVLVVEFTLGLPADRIGRPAGEDALFLIDPYLGDLNRHFVRAGARVCLADLIRVGFVGSDAVLSAAVVICRMEDHAGTHDVYGAAIRRGPVKGHETLAVLPAELRRERDVAATAAARVGANQPIAEQAE